MSNITVSGTVVCDKCDGDLVVRVLQFIGPKQQPSPNDLITHKVLAGAGNFSVLVPNSETILAIELLVDSNKDGIPTINERFVSLELGKPATADISGIELNASEGDVIETPEKLEVLVPN